MNSKRRKIIIEALEIIKCEFIEERRGLDNQEEYFGATERIAGEKKMRKAIKSSVLKQGVRIFFDDNSTIDYDLCYFDS